MKPKHLFISLTALTLLAVMQVKSQRIGNAHIWPKRINAPIAYEKDPCDALKSKLTARQGREPSIDALIQFCIVRSSLNQQGLNQALDAAIPNEIAIETKAVGGASPAQTAVSLRPALAEETEKNCDKLAFMRPRLCNPSTRQQVNSDVEQALANLIASPDERLSDIGLRWGLTLGERSKKVALLLPDDGPKNKAAAFLLRSRGLNGEARKEHIAAHLVPGDPLNPIATLEALSLNTEHLNAKIDILIAEEPSGLAASLAGKRGIKSTD